jgi:tRNA G46 methylase TrmB
VQSHVHCHDFDSLAQFISFKENGRDTEAVKGSRISSSQKRMKNPLGIKYLGPIPEAELQWKTIFSLPDRPIHIDIGCARGTMMQTLAQSHPHDFNYVGIELRPNLMVSSICTCMDETNA